jgi:hypothetical protein
VRRLGRAANRTNRGHGATENCPLNEGQLPKRSRRTCSPRYGLQSCWAGVAKRRCELVSPPNPYSSIRNFHISLSSVGALHLLSLHSVSSHSALSELHSPTLAQEASRQEGRIVQKFTYIIDLSDASLTRHLCTAAREFFSRLVSTDSANYPDALGHIHIINTSRIFPVIWSFVKNMVRRSIPELLGRKRSVVPDRLLPVPDPSNLQNSPHWPMETHAVDFLPPAVSLTNSEPGRRRWTLRLASGWRCFPPGGRPTKAAGPSGYGSCWARPL